VLFTPAADRFLMQSHELGSPRHSGHVTLFRCTRVMCDFFADTLARALRAFLHPASNETTTQNVYLEWDKEDCRWRGPVCTSF
jgi:hypothetical protein